MVKRVVVFIDGSNLYHGMRSSLGKINIDYASFVKKLVGDRELVRVYYYLPTVNKDEAEDQYKSQQRFLSYLLDIPYFHVKFGRLARQGNHLIEKSLDVQIAVDMVRYAANDLYDIAILVSGDGDFAPAVEAIKEMGKQVENAFFLNESSVHLRQISDKFIEFTPEFLEGCIFVKEEGDK